MQFSANNENLNVPIIIGAKGIEAIEQNMRIIIKTLAFSVPLDRAFASIGEFIDSPSPHHTAKLIANLTEALEKNEPRIIINSISLQSYIGDALKGKLYPLINYSIRSSSARVEI